MTTLKYIAATALLLALVGCSTVGSPSDMSSCRSPKDPNLKDYSSFQVELSQERYVLHDTVEDDYWLGEAHKWGEKKNAASLTFFQAVYLLDAMREHEEGGYANVPELTPIKIEPK